MRAVCVCEDTHCVRQPRQSSQAAGQAEGRGREPAPAAGRGAGHAGGGVCCETERGAGMQGGRVCGLWKGSRVARGVGGAEPLPWRVRGDSETPDALGRLKSPEEETPHCLSSRPQGDGAGRLSGGQEDGAFPGAGRLPEASLRPAMCPRGQGVRSSLSGRGSQACAVDGVWGHGGDTCSVPC